MTFIRYVGGCSVNSVCVALYSDNTTYILQLERDGGSVIRGSTVEFASEQELTTWLESYGTSGADLVQDIKNKLWS